MVMGRSGTQKLMGSLTRMCWSLVYYFSLCHNKRTQKSILRRQGLFTAQILRICRGPSWWGGTVAGTGGSISSVARKQTETNDGARLPFFLLIPEPQPMSDITTAHE